MSPAQPDDQLKQLGLWIERAWRRWRHAPAAEPYETISLDEIVVYNGPMDQYVLVGTKDTGQSYVPGNVIGKSLEETKRQYILWASEQYLGEPWFAAWYESLEWMVVEDAALDP